MMVQTGWTAAHRGAPGMCIGADTIRVTELDHGRYVDDLAIPAPIGPLCSRSTRAHWHWHARLLKEEEAHARSNIGLKHRRHLLMSCRNTLIQP